MRHVNEVVRKAMITVRQSFATECPFMTLKGTRGAIYIHFKPKGDPRVTWERPIDIKYKENQMETVKLFSRECDPANQEIALDVIEYTLFQYVDPKRKVLAGNIKFSFEDGIISNILATGNLVFEDCEA